MHYIKHRRLVRGLKLSAFFLLLAFASAITALALGIMRLMAKDLTALIPFGIAVGLFIISWFAYLIYGSASRCQLCKSTILRSLKCTRNKNATKLLGSHRVKVSASILLLNHFRCPYCGETFSCEKREVIPPTPEIAHANPQRSRRSAHLPPKR